MIAVSKQRAENDLSNTVDEWVIREEERRIGPEFEALSRRVCARLRTQGFRQAMDLYDKSLPAIVDKQKRLHERAVKRAVRTASSEFKTTVDDAYGVERSKAVMSMKAGAEDVVDRIINLPDEWGYTYSQRIWKNHGAVKNELSAFISRHMRETQNLARETEELMRFQLNDRSLPRYMQGIERSARSVLKLAPSKRKQAFLGMIKKERRYIASLTPGERGTQGFAKHVAQQMQKAIKDGSEEAIDAAVDLWINKRSRYRAQVLLRTETNRAYQEGSLAEYRDHDFVQAVKWNLTQGHSQPDECDLKARADVAGLGPGIYYKHAVPWPDHANGRCKLTPIMAEWEDTFDAKPHVPEDEAGYQQVLEWIKGPGAKQANQLGRSKGFTPAGFEKIVLLAPKVPPIAIPVV